MTTIGSPFDAFRRLAAVICAIAFLVGAGSQTFAGDRASVAGLSMARTFVASSRGLEAVGTNPANLALGDNNRRVTFTIVPPLGLNLGSDFIDYEIYDDYFTGVDTGGGRAGRFLYDADKEKILSVFPDGVAETHGEFEVRLFGLTVHTDNIGSFALAVTERAAFNFDMPRDYARFALYFLDTTGYEYNFSGTDARAWWLREYSLSYARLLPDLAFARKISAGVSLKIIHGFGYAGTDHYTARFASRPDPNVLAGYRVQGSVDFLVRRSGIDMFGEEKTSFSLFPAPAGAGFGIDFGVGGELLSGVRAAVSLVDIGSISWTRNVRERFGSATIDVTNPSSEAQRDSVENALKGDERNGAEFSTPLPTALRIGGALRLEETGWTPWLPGKMLVALDYHQGFNKSLGNTTRARLALGVEYRYWNFLPVRTGISVGGLDRFSWAFGFGFDFGAFTMDIGTENFALLFTPNSFDQFSFGLGMRIKI